MVYAILGEPGTGKTLLMKQIVDQLKKRRDFPKDQRMGDDFLPIIASSLNAESQMKFLNIWRPILQSMLLIHAKRKNVKPEYIVKRLIKSTL